MPGFAPPVVNTYLDLLGGYSEDQFEMTYYEHTGQEINTTMAGEFYQNESTYPSYHQGSEQFFYDTYCTNNGIVNGQRPVSGASYAEIDDRSESSGSSGAGPPALPIKRRSSSSTSPVSDFLFHQITFIVVKYKIMLAY